MLVLFSFVHFYILLCCFSNFLFCFQFSAFLVYRYGQISGETASATVNAGSLSDLSNLANVSLYGFEDYHGVDIGVVRAVRLWYSPIEGELPIEVRINDDDTKLGFAISRTEEVSYLIPPIYLQSIVIPCHVGFF